MITLTLSLSIFVILIVWIIKLGTKNKDFFKEKNIKFVTPTFIFGNTLPMWTRKRSIVEFLQDIYYKFPNEKIVGMFDLRRPLYFIRDPEIIKQITIKEFNHFVDHRVLIDDKVDPILGTTLVSQKGNHWREMRSALSPAFTGSKMRTMFKLVQKYSNELTSFYGKECETKTDYELEVKDFYTRIANDVIATCAFGLEVNSLEYKDNKFYSIGQKIMGGTVTFLAIAKFLGFLLVPKLMHFLRLSLLEKADILFFRKTILETIKIREEKNIFRPDLLNILMTAKRGLLLNTNEKDAFKEFSAVDEHNVESKNVKLTWSDDELIAQCLLFFLAGFETTANTLSFISYELAVNPDIQQRLINEIDNVNEQLNGETVDYDTIINIKYLDQVISEVLRKWPPAIITDRICSANLNKTVDNIDVKFKVNDYVWIPIYCIQNDPNYFPNPEIFDPDRFGDERKHEINPNTYLPFGMGPRNCIGSRFALMQMKTILFYVLLKYKFCVGKKTEIPFKFGIKNGKMIPETGIWIDLKPRNK